MQACSRRPQIHGDGGSPADPPVDPPLPKEISLVIALGDELRCYTAKAADGVFSGGAALDANCDDDTRQHVAGRAHGVVCIVGTHNRSRRLILPIRGYIYS